MTEFENIIEGAIKKIFDHSNQKKNDLVATVTELFEREEFAIKSQIIEWLQTAKPTDSYQLNIDYSLFEDKSGDTEATKLFIQLFREKMGTELLGIYYGMTSKDIFDKKSRSFAFILYLKKDL